MTQVPQISQQLEDTLRQRGYDGNRIYQVNKLPSFAIPRTTAYNLTTAALAGLSLVGYIVTKRNNLYSFGFGAALGLTFILDFAHRRQLDKTTPLSIRSSGSLELELEKHPEFKQAYETVSQEMDAKIAELEMRLHGAGSFKKGSGAGSSGSAGTTGEAEE